MKDLVDFLKPLLQGLTTWFFAIVSPVKTTLSVLQGTPLERRTSVVLALMFWTIVISLMITNPLNRLYGIEFANWDFYVETIVLMFLGFLLTIWCMHVTLKGFGLKSELQEIFVIYACTFLIYLPLNQLFTLPTLADQYSWLSNLKASGGLPTLSQIFSQGQQGILHDYPALAALVFTASLACSLMTSALFAEFVSQWFHNDRYWTFLAVVSGYALGGLSVVEIINLVSSWAILSYIK